MIIWHVFNVLIFLCSVFIIYWHSLKVGAGLLLTKREHIEGIASMYVIFVTLYRCISNG